MQLTDADTTWPLPHASLIGSAATCWPRLTEVGVSAAHASLTWRKGGWHLVDLHSTNGTWLDGKRVPPGQSCPVAAGAVLVFGRRDSRAWTFDGGPPAPFLAQPVTGEWHADADLITVTQGDRSASLVAHDGRWDLEESEPERVVTAEDGMVVLDTWRFHCPPTTATAVTTHRLELGQLTFVFTADDDWTWFQVDVTAPDGWTHRFDGKHWRVGWRLAQMLLDDEDASPRQRGWYDTGDLVADADAGTKNNLDQYISRMRRDLKEAGVAFGGAIVEARRGQRRLGVLPAAVTLAE